MSTKQCTNERCDGGWVLCSDEDDEWIEPCQTCKRWWTKTDDSFAGWSRDEIAREVADRAADSHPL